MDPKDELLPFIREMLQQRPSRGTLKIYAIGSALAVLGAIAGLIESMFTLGESEDAGPNEAIAEEAEAFTAPWTEVTIHCSRPDETKDDTIWTENRRSLANRLHAS